MTRRFRDLLLEEQLRTDGYVTLPFLDPAEVADLVEGYTSIALAEDEGLVIDFLRSDRSLVAEASALLEPIWRRHLARFFVDHAVVVATFVTKHPGPSSSMLLHDEPSFVDERRARSTALWIPLVDTGPGLGNGHLEVLPGSDALSTGMAGYRTPVQYRPYSSYLLPRLTKLTVRAGDAVVYDSRLLHASAANLSATPRPAIAAAIAPLDEPLVHVVPTGRRHRVVYRVDRAFFVDHHPADVGSEFPSGYAVIDEFDEDQGIGPDDIARIVGADAAPEPTPALPGDVSAPEPRRRFSHRKLREVPGQEDLACPSGNDTDIAGPTTVAVVERGSGVRVRRHSPACDGHLERRLVGLADLVRRAGSVDVVVLPEQSRLVVEPIGPHTLFVVVECPRVNAGMRDATDSIQFDVGTEVALPPGRVTMWNEGPGPLCGLLLGPDLRSSYAPASKAGVIARLRGHVSRWSAPRRLRRSDTTEWHPHLGRAR